MIPVLTHPLALAGLICIPALIGIYFFRNRFRRKPVSSLLLWSSIAPPKEGGAVFKNLQLPLTFLLELLALSLMLGAAVDPRWPALRKHRQIVVVLDDSASMGARVGPEAARDRAQTALLKEIRSGRFLSVRFVLAGQKPQVLGSTGRGEGEITRLLDGWSCTAPSASLESAVTMALDLAGKRSSILVVTDRPPRDVSEEGRIKWLAVGRAVPNVAIIAAARTMGVSGDRCFLEIANYSEMQQVADLAVTRENGVALQKSAVTLGPRESRKIVFGVAHATGPIRAVLGDDAIVVDNRADLLPSRMQRVRTRVNVANARLKQLLVRTIEATGMKAGLNTRPQIAFTDSAAGLTSGDAWTVRLNTPRNGKAYAGPYVVDHAHPAMQGLEFEGVIWGASATNRLPGSPVLSVGNVPLITDDRKATGRHDLHVQLCAPLSTVQDTPNWPALVWNIMNWRADRVPGLARHNVRSGTSVKLTTQRGVRTVEVTPPNSETMTLPAKSGGAMIETEQPGVYMLKAGDARHVLAANFTYPSESDLSKCASGRWGNWADAETVQRDYVGIAWVLVLLALAVLLAHLALASRKAEGR